MFALLMLASIAIHNESLTVRHSDERFEIASGKTAVADGGFTLRGGEARVRDVKHPRFGAGRAIEIARPGGGTERIALYPGLPFAIFDFTVGEAGLLNAVSPVSLNVRIGPEARALGTAGLTAPDKHPGSYAFLAVADPATRSGVVAGWLTHDRGSGVVFSSMGNGAVRIHPRIDYGRLKAQRGQALESLAVGRFEDARLGLEAWAAAVARVYDIHLPGRLAGYCTWYSRPFGGASDERHLAELTAFAAQHLKPFGFDFIQIDDKWQKGARRQGPAKNFTGADPAGPYPHGMKAAADDVLARGLVPGIWFMPFAGDHMDPFFQPHPEWFVKRGDGQVFETRWGGSSLDMTHPGAREYLRDVVRRAAREWGYRYFKLDGLYTGTATEQVYINSGYKQDGIGGAVFHDPAKTNIEAFRDGLKLVRQTAGKDVFLLGCTATQNMRSFGGSFGLVDAMRIGPDNGPKWESLIRGPLYGSRLYFLDGRVWYNDPDPVYVRPDVPIEQARMIVSWVAVSGQWNVSSEWLPGLPPDRLDLLKRSMPYHGLQARPVDLFEHEPARIWLLSAKDRYIVALYNWDAREAVIDTTAARIGLPKAAAYAAFDYWDAKPLDDFTSRLRVTVPGRSCRIIAVRPAVNHPQLISTSRHITQGIVDVLEESWEGSALAGASQVVGGDPYEMRFTGEVADASADAGVKIAKVAPQRVRIDSPDSRRVAWRVRFK